MMAIYRHTEESRWGNVRHNHARPRQLSLSDLIQQTPPAAPKPWDDISNWQGKSIWGTFQGTRQKLYIQGRAPEGQDGERWYIQPSNRGTFWVTTILKSELELIEKPVTCTALALVPDNRRMMAEIKKRLAGRSLTNSKTIYI